MSQPMVPTAKDCEVWSGVLSTLADLFLVMLM
jgi:hypothetical protein